MNSLWDFWSVFLVAWASQSGTRCWKPQGPPTLLHSSYTLNFLRRTAWISGDTVDWSWKQHTLQCPTPYSYTCTSDILLLTTQTSGYTIDVPKKQHIRARCHIISQVFTKLLHSNTTTTSLWIYTGSWCTCVQTSHSLMHWLNICRGAP